MTKAKNIAITKKELQEPMFVTWGRIRTAVYQLPTGTSIEKLQALVEKFNKDLANSKIEEGYFNG